MPACATCLLPADGPRTSEAHTGVRFGDVSWAVLLDCRDVTCRCTEAMAGPAGWVVLQVEPLTPCERSGGDHVVTELVYGNVQVTRSAR